uniref:Uncharacterized protein n=1 Tax=mine drainage metagenome TaxID=410659 RepID=E6PJC7_9ZZZZ
MSGTAVIATFLTFEEEGSLVNSTLIDQATYIDTMELTRITELDARLELSVWHLIGGGGSSPGTPCAVSTMSNWT